MECMRRQHHSAISAVWRAATTDSGTQKALSAQNKCITPSGRPSIHMEAHSLRLELPWVRKPSQRAIRSPWVHSGVTQSAPKEYQRGACSLAACLLDVVLSPRWVPCCVCDNCSLRLAQGCQVTCQFRCLPALLPRLLAWQSVGSSTAAKVAARPSLSAPAATPWFVARLLLGLRLQTACAARACA